MACGRRLMNNPPLSVHTREQILQRMSEELHSAGTAAAAAWASIRAQAAKLPLRGYDNIVVTGCGDSYYAGLAMRPALEQLGGVPTVIMPSMEAATFRSLLMTDRCLLVGVSVSGKVERTIEAVAAHRKRGGMTIAITALPDNALAEEADFLLTTGLRGTPGPVPGTANYLGSLLGLVALSWQLASRRRATVSFSDDDVIKMVEQIDTGFVQGTQRSNALRQFAPPFFALGTGPDLGAASYGVAKFLEAAATVGVAQDLEEWAHEQYFATREGSTVFVISTTSATNSRALRVAHSVSVVGGTPVMIGLRSDSRSAVNLQLPSTPEILAPLVSWVPLAALALRYAQVAGRFPFGIDRPERMATVDNDIYVGEAVRDEH
jgi:glutamine---fructose-6-phosphate transaminase (isomerizing)